MDMQQAAEPGALPLTLLLAVIKVHIFEQNLPNIAVRA
jgi:hypothetical protein